MAQEEINQEAAGAAEQPKPRTRRKLTEEQKAAAAAKRRATIAAKKAAAAAAEAAQAGKPAAEGDADKSAVKKTASKKAADKEPVADDAAAKKAAKPAAKKKAASTKAKVGEADKADSAARADAKPAESAGDAGDDAAASPAPKRRGRPRRSDEEKARRKAEREAKKAAEAAQAAQEAGSSADKGAAEGGNKPAADAAQAGGKTGDQGDAGADAQAEGSKGRRRNNRRRKRNDTDQQASGDVAEAKPAAEGAEAAAAGEAKPDADTEAKGKGEGDNQDGQGRQDRYRDRRNNRRKNRNRNTRREIAPSATRDELANLADEELIAKAAELGVDHKEYGERDDLVSAVYDALLQAEGFVMVDGILDLMPDGYGFIRTNGYLAGEHDVYVGASMVRRNALRRGDYIAGRVRPARENEKYPALNMIVSLNGEPFEGPTHRVKFAQLTPVYPDERLVMEHGHNTYTARAIDLVAPIGKGQRGLIVSPPKAGKTTVLKDIAAAISANNPEVHLMCLLVDERPEEVTDMERSIDGEVISSTFDMPCENHIAVAELVIERAKRLVEQGQDVVILLDSITRLARAYNLGTPASGRILSGGVDSGALYPPKRFLGAARNIENGGSLTILGTALVETGSKMDEVIFEEFKGTGNMELKLDRQLADRRIFPAIDPVTSGTRKEGLLLDPQEAPLIWGLRRLLANMNNTERAMDMLVKSLRQTDDNREFLIKSAKKAQKTNVGANL